MANTTLKFYDEIIKEQSYLMDNLKDGNDIKKNTQALTLVNNLIKNIYKYNQYLKDKSEKSEDPNNSKKLVVKFH